MAQMSIRIPIAWLALNIWPWRPSTARRFGACLSLCPIATVGNNESKRAERKKKLSGRWRFHAAMEADLEWRDCTGSGTIVVQYFSFNVQSTFHARREDPMKFSFFSAAIASLLLTATLPGCVTRTSYVDLYGMAAPPQAAVRTIPIAPNTNYVNVEGGEIIRFVSGDREFAWHFLVARTVRAFDLNEVAPPGILDHTVRAYVSPDPRYIGAVP